MSRGITTRRDAMAVLRMRLASDLSEIDHWTGSFDLGDDVIGLLLDARGSVKEAIELIAAVEEIMPEKER